MQEIRRGMFARSLAGHDAGRLYLVWAADQDYLYLTDGTHRTVERPKKKKRRHAQIDYRIAPELEAAIASGAVIRDEDIRKAIRQRGGNA